MYIFLFTEAAGDVTITVEVDNPFKVLENTPIVYLRWNFSVSGSDPLKEVDFFISKEGADEYIGYLTDTKIKISSSFSARDRFTIERPATLIIRNVSASDAAKYMFAVELDSAERTQSIIDLHVLGKAV